MRLDDGTAGFLLAVDPVEITDESNDMWDVALRRSCTIFILSDHYEPDFYRSDCRQAKVNITIDGDLEFCGYIEPMAYSQPYNSRYDQIELHCVDPLSALDSMRYSGTSKKTLGEILLKALGMTCENLKIGDKGGLKVMYDGSRSLTLAHTGLMGGTPDGGSPFEGLSLVESLFEGSAVEGSDPKESDGWSALKVVEEILRFLNLHIFVDKDTVYIADYATIADWGAWEPLSGAMADAPAYQVAQTINADNCYDRENDSIDINEIYNRIEITAVREEEDNVVDNPLESDALYPVYDSSVRYCREYISEIGEGKGSYESQTNRRRAMNAMTVDLIVDGWSPAAEQEVTRRTHRIRVLNHPYWKFRYHATRSPWESDIIADYTGEGHNQADAPNILQPYDGALMLEVETGEEILYKSDTSISADSEKGRYMVIGGGWRLGQESDKEETADAISERIWASIPRAEFNPGTTMSLGSGAMFGSRSYLVISGKIKLNPAHVPLYSAEGFLAAAKSDPVGADIPREESESGERFYVRRYHKGNVIDGSIDPSRGQGLFPKEDEERYYKLPYNFSGVGEDTDKISMLGVLACMLIIGDKCLVEESPGDCHWRDYKEKGTVSDEEYYAQSFTIGIDPKIGDYIVGPEYDIANNIDWELGLGRKGTAVSLPNNLMGEVRFLILGPVNLMWDDITKRAGNFWRHTKYTTTSRALMAEVSAIWLKDLTIEVVSASDADEYLGRDIVYTSDTDETFRNLRAEQWKINSALTVEERQSLRLKDTPSKSVPVHSIGSGVTELYDNVRGVSGKAEELYIDWYYNYTHNPKITMTVSVRDSECKPSRWGTWKHWAMSGKTFMVRGVSRTPSQGFSTLTLCEI